MSHAAAKPFNTCWRPDSEEASKTKSSAKKQSTNLASFDHDTLIGLAELVHPVYVNYDKVTDKTYPCRRPAPT